MFHPCFGYMCPSFVLEPRFIRYVPTAVGLSAFIPVFLGPVTIFSCLNAHCFFLASRWVSQNRWYVTVFQDPENDHFRSSQPAVNTKMAQTGPYPNGVYLLLAFYSKKT